jgi:hypothetical protein
MEQRERMVAFWLVAAADERAFFSSLIDLLAVRFGAPRFEPHVTLLGGHDIDPERAAEALRKLPPIEPIELEIERIDFSDKFTKTLFVQFRQSSEAGALADAIREATGSKTDYQLNPHLSLVYKDLPKREKAEVADSLELPFEDVVFDTVKVITGPAGTSTREDVEAWQTLGERRLSK